MEFRSRLSIRKTLYTNKEFEENEGFYGRAYMKDIKIKGPTNQVSININGELKVGLALRFLSQMIILLKTSPLSLLQI